MSAGDRAREKLEFYARVRVNELLLIDRAPWALELFRLSDSGFVEVGVSTIANQALLTAQTVPLSFRLALGTERPSDRPRVEVSTVPPGRFWLI